MGKILTRLFIAFSLLTLMLTTSCGNEGCVEGQVSYAVGSFSKLKTTETEISSVAVYGTGTMTDSVMVKAAALSNTLDIRLDPASVETYLRFEFALKQPTDTISDTIVFFYENHDFFLDIECGCVVFHYIDSISHTNHIIQQIEIINPEITNEKTPNFKIYY